jgi:hypothetical protein
MRSATGWATAALLAVLCPAQCWAAASPVARVTSTVAATVKPTVSSAAKDLAVSVKTPELPATPLSAPVPIVSAKAPNVPAVSVQVTAPAVSVKADPSGVSVSATVPAVSVKATVPAVSVNASAPAVSVKTTVPAVSAKASTPAVSVKTTGAPSAVVTTSASGVSVKPSGASRSGGGLTVPAVAVERPGASLANNTGPPPSGVDSRRVTASRATAGVAHNGPAASVSAAVLSGDASTVLGGGLSASFGQQTFSAYANPSGGRSPQRGAAGAVAHQRLLEREAREIVRRLMGCLATLSPRQRLLLELLIGVGVPRALTRDQVALALHIRSTSVPRLERMAIASLLVLARTTACGGVARSAPTMELASYTVLAVPGGVEAASGGVKAARYAKAPSGGSGASTRASGRSELASIPASHTGTLLILIATLVAALAIVALSVDAVGAGPRNRRWRARWMAGQRQAWRRKRRR